MREVAGQRKGKDFMRERVQHWPGAAAAVVAALCWILAGAGCRGEVVEHEPVVRPVKMLTIGEGGPSEEREYPGTVSAAQHVEMAFEVPGRIIDFPVTEGQEVSTGTLLARLDPRDYEARLDSARADVRKAEADQARSRKLYSEDPGAIALTTLDADRRAVEVARARYREHEKALEDTILRAPFDGVVARKLVRDFANIQAKEPVLILQDTSQLEMVINVPERDFVWARGSTDKEEITARLKPRVVVSALPDRIFPARPREIATTADPVTRTFAATFIFDTPDDVTVLPGMTAKVVIRSPARRAGEVRIPVRAATADEDGSAFVWLVDPSSMTVKPRAVELGQLSGDTVEVRSGLDDGDIVAVSGVSQLRDGMRVRHFEN